MNRENGSEVQETLTRLVDLKAHLSPVVVEMLSVLTAMFRRKGLPEEIAEQHAQSSVLELAFLMGGRILYLPKAQKLRRVLRDIHIADQLGKRTAAELATENGLSVQAVYEIAQEQRRQRKSGDITHPRL